MTVFHTLVAEKRDGRKLILYGLEPISLDFVASAGFLSANVNPHLRWHELRGEWVAFTAHRQTRTFLPSTQGHTHSNPLKPATHPNEACELPAGRYDIAVFDNLFPALRLEAHSPPRMSIATRAARGCCEVVVYAKEPEACLSRLPLPHLELLLYVWGERTAQLMQNPIVKYVLPFENRGVEMGVSLHHPHGQIYAYPNLPPVPKKMNHRERIYFKNFGRTLLQKIIAEELQFKQRLLYCGEHAVAFVPACARYPYEVWVAPRRAVAYLHELTTEVRSDLANALKTVLTKYDALWQRPLPYLMAWFQAPVDGRPHPEAHLHAEFYPPYRTENKLKYLAGTELAAGFFTNDALPEDTARELQRCN
jgi:UDPglucose--hexose-1-phosphate uridylyltransferase